jgi:uncharacterized membrane protein YeiB
MTTTFTPVRTSERIHIMDALRGIVQPVGKMAFTNYISHSIVGTIEWLWRSATYKKWQQFRKKAEAN